MKQTVLAIVDNGVLRPLTQHFLQEGQKVTLQIEPVEEVAPEEVTRRQAELLRRMEADGRIETEPIPPGRYRRIFSRYRFMANPCRRRLSTCEESANWPRYFLTPVALPSATCRKPGPRGSEPRQTLPRETAAFSGRQQVWRYWLRFSARCAWEPLTSVRRSRPSKCFARN